MSRELVTWLTVGVLLLSNSIGLVYSLIVLKTNVFNEFRIQKKSYKKGIFASRMPLFLFNFIVLLIFSGGGAYMLYDFLDAENNAFWIIGGQLLFVFVIDDVFFYFMHRYLHENKYLLKKIHSIHHRATTPFPLEYLYAHPLEWMSGMLGVVIAFALILVIMPINVYAFLIFGLLRNLHEIQIHSDLELPLISKIPFVSKTRHHDDHHAKLTGNYASTFVWMDKIFKTRF